MKRVNRKFAQLNLALMAIVLFSTLYQSFHAFTHKPYPEPVARHTTLNDKSDNGLPLFHSHITEQHTCSICDFHFDFFIAPAAFCLKLDFLFKEIPYTFSSKENNTFFAGSLYAHRGPPALV